MKEDILAIISGYITRPCIIRMLCIVTDDNAKYNIYFRRYRSPSVIKTDFHMCNKLFHSLKNYRDSYIFDNALYKLDKRQSDEYVTYYSNGMINKKLRDSNRFSLSILYSDYIVIKKVTWICLSGHRYNTRYCNNNCDMNDGGWSYIFYINGELKNVESQSEWDILSKMCKIGRFLY